MAQHVVPGDADRCAALVAAGQHSGVANENTLLLERPCGLVWRGDAHAGRNDIDGCGSLDAGQAGLPAPLSISGLRDQLAFVRCAPVQSPLCRAASLLVVLSLLLVQLPADRRTYQAEMEEETLCEYTLQQNQFDSDTVLLTDISHFSWTILSYYYPENENKALNMDESLEPQRQYALFLSAPLTEEQSEWLAEQGRPPPRLHSRVCSAQAPCIFTRCSEPTAPAERIDKRPAAAL